MQTPNANGCLVGNVTSASSRADRGCALEAYLTAKMSITHTCEYFYKTFHFTVSWEN